MDSLSKPVRVDPDSLGFLLADVARLMRAEMDRAITRAGIGLTPAEVRTLVHAARAGHVRQLVLAERMGVEAMTLSTCLDQLESKGMVRREPDPSDRRAKLVTVTESAIPILDMIPAMSAELRAMATEGLGRPDQERLRESLLVLRRNLCVPPEGRRTSRQDA